MTDFSLEHFYTDNLYFPRRKIAPVMVMRTRIAVCMLLCATSLLWAETILMGQNYWAVPWARSDPFKDGFDNVTGDNPWKPGLISESEPYHILRFMDWSHTNQPYRDTRWEPNTFTVEDPSWAWRKQKNNPNQMLVAYEWQIDICNRTNSHGWFCVPHESDLEYCTKLAILIKTGVDMKNIDLTPFGSELSSMTAEEFLAAGGIRTHDPLRSDLKAYIEYSNETWLFQWTELEELGAPMGLDANQYHAFGSAQLFHGFDRIFGKDSKRIVRVMSGQAGNWWVGDKRLEFLHGTNEKITCGYGTRADAYAIAAYWNDDPDRTERWMRHKEVADKYGIDLCFYEGGNGSGAPNSDGKAGATKDPAMYEKYQEWFRIMENVGFTFGCHYVHSGTREWATIDTIAAGYDEAMTFSKYRALAEYATKDPTEIRFFPTVRRHSTGSGAIIDRRPPSIFHLNGRSIGTVPNGAAWSGRKSAGTLHGSGAFVIVPEKFNGRSRRVLKMQ